MFRSRFFVFYSPEGGGGGGGGGTTGGSGEPAGGSAPNNQNPAPTGGNNGGNGVESLYKDKIDALHSDLSSVRALNKDLGTKLSTAEAELAGYKLAEKKTGMLGEIQEKLGDFEIPADKLGKLQGLIKVLPDGDDLGDRITEMVDLIKVPKTTGEPKPPYSSFSGGTPTGNAASQKAQTFTPGERLTPGQVANLSPDDLSKYLRSFQG